MAEEYSLKLVIDDNYHWFGKYIEKHITIDNFQHIKKRDKAEEKKKAKMKEKEEYLETIYTWSLRRFLRPFQDSGFDITPIGASKRTGNLLSSNVLQKINTDYCYDFEYEPEEKDILIIGYDYRNPQVKGWPRPYISGHLLFVFNSEKWEEKVYMMDHFTDLYHGILYITPK
jgi:hypothetical protein